MPRRAATLPPMLPIPPMSASFAPPFARSMPGTAQPTSSRAPIKRLFQTVAAAALFGVSGFAFAQTPVCFDSFGHPLPSEQCSQAARDQAASQAAASGTGSPSLQEECRALADKIANTPDKPVYTRGRRVESPAGDRVDMPKRTNPRKALKEEYARKCM